MRAALLALIVGLAACGGDDETREVRVHAPAGGMEMPAEELVAVRNVRIGAALGADGSVSESVEFQPGDSVFVSAEFEGSVEQASVVARLTRADGTVVGEQERFVPLAGEKTVVFDFAPAEGLSPGRYRVELLLGGERVGDKEFSVGG